MPRSGFFLTHSLNAGLMYSMSPETKLFHSSQYSSIKTEAEDQDVTVYKNTSVLYLRRVFPSLFLFLMCDNQMLGLGLVIIGKVPALNTENSNLVPDTS